MKKYLLLSLLSWFTIGSSIGQITYTSISFPQAGDVLAISTAVDSMLTITPPSATATAWDFSQLTAVTTNYDTIQAASSGAFYAQFPNSDILQPLLGQVGVSYTEVTATQIERIGGGFEILGISFINSFANTHITQTVPLTYNDMASDAYAFRFSEHIDSVPFLRQLIDSLVSGLPFGLSPDSIRIAIDGDEDRVLITDHRAIYNGGGVYVFGTGKATLINTFIARNITEDHGAGLYATNGGTSNYQVIMDRAETCPFIISCSEFEKNTFISELVYINNSKVKISRTLFDRNEQFSADNEYALINVRPGAVLHMSHSNMLANDSDYLFDNTGTTEVSHHTAARNYSQPFSGNPTDSHVWHSTLGNLRFENSIFQNTQGGHNAPTTSPNISGKCNLIDNSTDWPGGSYTFGTVQFVNAPGGDARQVASSDGVDMCLEDTFAWSSNRDIEYQTSPVNENTNPQGMPGNDNGLYDAGFDEVYDNIGPDEFLLTVQKEGSGTGFVLSDPLGISCGSDCTEVIFNGTLVTLTATGTSKSDFTGWRACPLPNGNECLTTVTQSQTIYAEFQPDDLIFSDGFE